MSSSGWYGVDLDGTLAEYHGWEGPEHIGKPIPEMVERIKGWLEEGIEVKIFTARVTEAPLLIRQHYKGREYFSAASLSRAVIQNWLEEIGLPRLEVTNVKDYAMLQLWDDRAIQVEHNSGKRVGDVEPIG